MNTFFIIIISFMAGFLSTMNIYATSRDNIKFHINDVYMISLMVAWMMLFYSIFYEHDNVCILGFLFFIIIIIIAIRKQLLVDDKQFIKGMIPNYSMAIKMAEEIKNKSSNKDIIDLANNIINNQTNEVNTMQNLLEKLN